MTAIPDELIQPSPTVPELAPDPSPAPQSPSLLPLPRPRGARGTGAMGPRVRRGDDEPAPTRHVVDAAAATARTTGHRFDLMRYLRLRRRH